MSFRILETYLRQRHGVFRTRRQLRSYQEKQIQRCLAEILPRSPYTKERLMGRPIEEWHTMNPMTKRDMMDNFDRLNTVGLTKHKALQIAKQKEQSRTFDSVIDGYTVGLSSGTSGRLGVFVVGNKEQEQWVGRILAKVLPEHLLFPKRDRVAFFLRASSPLYERTSSRRLAFHYFDLSKEIQEHLSSLESLDPTILIAPPSFLRQLVPFIENKTIRIQPQKIITVAEPLDMVDERLFRNVFGQTIHQIYQATEGFLGTTCHFGTMHLNEELLIFEREHLDKQRFVPIITDMYRTTLPIIRYRLDDVLKLRPTPCSCGSLNTAIESIEGRCDDILLFPKQDGTNRAIYADFWRRCIIMSDNRILDYGLRQVQDNRLELFILSSDEREVRSIVEKNIHTLIQKNKLEPIIIDHISTWPQGGYAKKKRIERKIQEA